MGEVNGWRILHEGDNEREGQRNEGADRDWVAKLKGYMEQKLLQRGAGDIIIPVAL